jgi:hypothetical protein
MQLECMGGAAAHADQWHRNPSSNAISLANQMQLGFVGQTFSKSIDGFENGKSWGLKIGCDMGRVEVLYNPTREPAGSY